MDEEPGTGWVILLVAACAFAAQAFTLFSPGNGAVSPTVPAGLAGR